MPSEQLDPSQRPRASASWRAVIRLQCTILAFRDRPADRAALNWRHLAWIVGITWLAGVGRYWDHPAAAWWQYAGLGSLAYIAILSAVLFVVVMPLAAAEWTQQRVLVFVGLTSLPALLYAIPVERFLTLAHAQAVNWWFLIIVATWRVVLYARFLKVYANLRLCSLIVATLLPLTAIVASLAVLNLEHVVFTIMAGIREEDASAHDSAYSAVLVMAFFAVYGFPIIFIAYCIECFLAMRRRQAQQADQPGV